MYNLNYTPKTLGVKSRTEIISGGTRTKEVEFHWSRKCGSLDVSQLYGPLWSVTGIYIFFLDSGRCLMAVALTTAARL
jgi:hypothetical protein